jgi:hypothetical protein
MSTDATASEDSVPDGQLSTRVRLARYGFVLLAALFIVGVMVQVFIAGMAVFVNPARWSMHATFVHYIELLLPVMLVLAFLGRLSWGLKLAPVVLFLLIVVQYTTALSFSASVVAALHPVNALVIFGIATMTTRRTWRAISEQAGAGT